MHCCRRPSLAVPGARKAISDLLGAFVHIYLLLQGRGGEQAGDGQARVDHQGNVACFEGELFILCCVSVKNLLFFIVRHSMRLPRSHPTGAQSAAERRDHGARRHTEAVPESTYVAVDAVRECPRSLTC